jgi:hypothetical protein
MAPLDFPSGAPRVLGILITPGTSTGSWLSKACAYQEKAQSTVQVSLSVDDALTMAVDDWLVVLTDNPDAGSNFRADQTRDLSRLFAQSAERGGVCQILGEGETSGAVKAAEDALLQDVGMVRRPSRKVVRTFALFDVSGPSTPIPFDLLRLNEKRLLVDRAFPTFDLSGRPDVLAWGPHMMLPSGGWRLSIVFEVDRAAAVQSLAFEWGDLKVHERHEVSLGRAGRYDFAVDRVWTSAAIAEFRISAAHAVFAGSIRLISVTIGRTPTLDTQAALNQL